MTSPAEEAEAAAKKQFDADDKVWDGPRYIRLGVITLVIAISLIYFMSTTTGCHLTIAPSFQ
ncbi:MAG: hypothetical protein FWD17_01965 [Polyangiaceae bacterium]|nr:hypothetical protein [Polyangiaceae bacterium]